jgi:hypothetical protein
MRHLFLFQRIGSCAGLVAVLAISATASSAQTPVAATAQRRVEEGSSTASAGQPSGIQLTTTDLASAEIWGLNKEEALRAKLLLQGPRKAFSVENLSPIEALGIHARSEAERRKYAEMFVRAFHADVERSLAWNRAFTEAMARMYPNEPIVDFSQLPKVQTSIGAADTLNVPRTNIIETPGPGYTPLPLSQRKTGR